MARNYFLYALFFWISMITTVFFINLPISLNLMVLLNLDQVEKALILISLNLLIGEYFNFYSIIIWLIISILSSLLFNNQKDNLIFCSILYLFTSFIFIFLVIFYNVFISNAILLFYGIIFSALLFFLPSSSILFVKTKFFNKEVEKQEIEVKWVEFKCPTCNTKFNSNPKYCSNCNSLMQIWFQITTIILK